MIFFYLLPNENSSVFRWPKDGRFFSRQRRKKPTPPPPSLPPSLPLSLSLSLSLLLSLSLFHETLVLPFESSHPMCMILSLFPSNISLALSLTPPAYIAVLPTSNRITAHSATTHAYVHHSLILSANQYPFIQRCFNPVNPNRTQRAPLLRCHLCLHGVAVDPSIRISHHQPEGLQRTLVVRKP